MTNLEYIRQLPGMAEKYAFECGCPMYYGFDHQKCTGNCYDCLNVEDTIGGKPAPYLFACPVTPGQIVYSVLREYGTFDLYIERGEIQSIEFPMSGGWVANFSGFGRFYDRGWLVTVFPTKEEAEQKLKEMLNNG